MAKEKKLLVTARYGSLEFYEKAWPYNENAHDEQVETCLDSICQQIKDAGKAEMRNAFTVTEMIVKA
jgi:hypothetical protein